MPAFKPYKRWSRRPKPESTEEGAQDAKPAPPRQNLSGGRVTALQPQVKRPNRYSLYIDDHFALGLSMDVAIGIRVGQEMTNEDMEKLAHAEQLQDAHERALRFLEQRPRSADEIRRRLASKKFSSEIIEAVIVRLTEVQLLGDRSFAKYWVESRENFKPRSARALKYELRQKGVPDQDIARAVSKLDERDSAYRAARNKALRFKDLEAKEFRDKVGGFLARRGFDYGVTRDTVNKLWQEMHGKSLSEIESESDTTWLDRS